MSGPYANTPVIALSRPDATHIRIAPVTVTFQDGREVRIESRDIPIPDPGDETVGYYVTALELEDGSFDAFAETMHDKCGTGEHLYLGWIECGPVRAIPLPGGWPAPQRIFSEVP
jgi:hypothetical protein